MNRNIYFEDGIQSKKYIRGIHVSVIIPNYNGKHFLKCCIESLQHQTYKNIEIIVVDNHSSDGSVSFLQENYPEVKIIELDHNTGFSYAANKGIRYSQAEHVFLLNNDMEVHEACIENLVKLMKDKQKCFSVNAKMIQFNNRGYLDDAGDEYNAFGIPFKRGWNKKVESENKVRRVFATCAGASLYKREVFKEIGYFDEEFFAYFEDVDLGYRANILGYKNYFQPDAIVYHIVSGTTGNKVTEFKTMLSARNNIFIIYKNMPLWQIILNFPFLFIGMLLKLKYFSKFGYGRIFLIETGKAIGSIIKDGKIQKVRFQKKHLLNYLFIQKRLIINCFSYIYRTYLRS